VEWNEAEEEEEEEEEEIEVPSHRQFTAHSAIL